jgi:hypothetical protein
MLRRWLAAILALGINTAGASPGFDWDDDDEPRHSQEARESSPAGDVAESFVGVVRLQSPDDRALVKGLAKCRDRGDLKVRVVSGAGDAGYVRAACEQQGFTFSRQFDAAGIAVMEFYTDLYYVPRSRPPAKTD